MICGRNVLMNSSTKILIAGIGGASLGTEILKSLILAKRYAVYGCDISELAYGHYEEGFKRTFLVDRETYGASIINICRSEGIEYLIPGGEEPMVLLGAEKKALTKNKIKLVGNSDAVIKTFSDKFESFVRLKELGFRVPNTKTIIMEDDYADFTYPCIVKPSVGSGGSSFVFLAGDKEEAKIYYEYLNKNDKIPVLQEYLPADEGEFTVGVLSLPNRDVVGSIALKRIFNSKLSVSYKGKYGLISSGYSQGLIRDFPDICRTAEEIAAAIHSEGPINIQGRLVDGSFIPFEINPRFSASTYLRALAGFNEIDVFLQYLINNRFDKPEILRPGYYLRGFSELYFREDEKHS
jgi:carbamoyl-phosphate synthase large subunit